LEQRTTRAVIFKRVLQERTTMAKKMTVKDCIDKLVARNKELNSFIEAANKKNDADKALTDYLNYLAEVSYNSALSLQFSYVLQMSRDPTLFEQFELRDIERLYDSFLELFDNCSDIYIDAANFADAIMDNKDRAMEIIETGISKLKTQLAELEELQKDLNA
jgi:hypothetical protein